MRDPKIGDKRKLKRVANLGEGMMCRLSFLLPQLSAFEFAAVWAEFRKEFDRSTGK